MSYALQIHILIGSSAFICVSRRNVNFLTPKCSSIWIVSCAETQLDWVSVYLLAPCQTRPRRVSKEIVQLSGTLIRRTWLPGPTSGMWREGVHSNLAGHLGPASAAQMPLDITAARPETRSVLICAPRMQLHMQTGPTARRTQVPAAVRTSVSSLHETWEHTPRREAVVKTGWDGPG